MTAHYDYDRQAWVVNGRYVRCDYLIEGVGKLTEPTDAFTTACQCYERLHEGEPHVCQEGCQW